MAVFECPICHKRIINALVCRQCKQGYDLSEPWARKLITLEKQWRNSQLRDQRHGLTDFSDYILNVDGESYDGWDVVDGEIAGRTGDAFVKAMSVEDDIFVSTELDEELLEWEFYQLAEEADLTEGEFNAFYVYLFLAPNNDLLSSKEGASMLSEYEGKEVSPDAFRRRLSDARVKLKRVAGLLDTLRKRLKLNRWQE
jgi:hypothetical protein